jgi:hydroxymethylpyrimidine/phosphomethylpyrimidine kinase
MIHTVLTVAGSDPSGGAGIQADIKTFTSLKVYGMAVITALTAQNTVGVNAVLDVSPEFVSLQLDAVLSDIAPAAVKTGMLANTAIIEVVAGKLRQYGVSRLVLDPVLAASSGASLLDPAAVDTFKSALIPLALLITPNTEEAAVLTGSDVHSLRGMEEAARRLVDIGASYALIKGGHLEGDPVDVLYDGVSFTQYTATRITTSDVHGTGCVLSAAIAAYLATGFSIEEAVGSAKRFVTESIRRGLRIGRGKGPCDPVGLSS